MREEVTEPDPRLVEVYGEPHEVYTAPSTRPKETQYGSSRTPPPNTGERRVTRSTSPEAVGNERSDV